MFLKLALVGHHPQKPGGGRRRATDILSL